jgi:hypothetical protein
MAEWRMAFRAGTNGYDLWPECRKLGVAIIQYSPLDDFDLTKFPIGEPKDRWAQLSGSAKTSLCRFIIEMKKGDTIYVKSGPMIVGKGIVDSPYIFDKANRVVHDGVPWQHQRRVKWLHDVPEVENPTNQNIVTVKPLSAADVKAIEVQYGSDKQSMARAATDADIEGLRYEIVTMTTKRSRRLRDKAFQMANGICLVCEYDYSKLLDGKGVRVLQVHHKRMLSKSEAETKTTLKDLVVVCANCHLLLHLDPKKVLSVAQLKKMLAASSDTD